MLNNASLGMTLQKCICEKYHIDVPARAKAQFESNFNPDYKQDLEGIIPKILANIGGLPKSCITFASSEKENERLSPHNFILTSEKTFSIRTNQNNDKVAPRVVGQCGIESFNKFFSGIAGFEIKDKQQIKDIIFSHIHEMLPTFLEYLFTSDYTVWLRFGKDDKYEYTIFDKNQYVDISLMRENFSFTREGLAWKESTTLKYNGISIAEIQIHSKRTFKFRFIMKALQKFLHEVNITNETFGMTAEKTICDIFNLEYPVNFKKRCSPVIQNEILPVVKEAFCRLPNAIRHTGSERGGRGDNSKCSYDFVLAGDKTLSLKTNTGKMICPPEVGQPGADTCYLYFGHLTDAESIDGTLFKGMVLQHIGEMIPIYIDHLFDSDYLLWIFKRQENNYGYKIFERDFAKNIKWKSTEFSFTKPTIEEWNESNTLKYSGISLGEFQVHKGRSCFKFRFNMENLEKVINGFS